MRYHSLSAYIRKKDTNGHGTFLAGIAAGRKVASLDFTGASPGCKIGVVKLKKTKKYLRDYYMVPDSVDHYQSTDLIMATAYLRPLAARHRIPFVICMGLGSNQGGHNGLSPLCQVSNNLQPFPGGSAAHVAGAAANLYSWGIVQGNSPHLTSSAVKSCLARGASRNSNFNYPNQEWGACGNIVSPTRFPVLC